MCWRRGTRHYPRFLEAPTPSLYLREDAARGPLTLVERTHGLPPQRRLAAEAMVLCCRKAGQDALDRWVLMHLPDASPIDQASPHDVRGGQERASERLHNVIHQSVCECFGLHRMRSSRRCLSRVHRSARRFGSWPDAILR